MTKIMLGTRCHHHLRHTATNACSVVQTACLQATLKYILVLLLLTIAQPALAAEHPLPFAPGEKLTYDLSWSHFVTAGISTLAVNDAGSGDYFLEMTGRTTGFVGTLYAVHDTTIGRFDATTLRPRSCVITVSENSYRKRKSITFDHDKGIAHYQINTKDAEIFDVTPHAQGPVSVLYAFRANRAKVMANDEILLPLFDDRKMYLLRIRKLGYERLNLPMGMIDTVKFEADLKTEAMFRFQGKMTLWLSNDAAFAPVQIESEVMIGSIFATLREFEGTPITIIPYPVDAGSYPQ